MNVTEGVRDGRGFIDFTKWNQMSSPHGQPSFLFPAMLLETTRALKVALARVLAPTAPLSRAATASDQTEDANGATRVGIVAESWFMAADLCKRVIGFV